MSTNFDSITERMLEAGRLKNFTALAMDLGITPQAVSNYRKRGEFPASLAIRFARKHGVSLDWLFTGSGAPRAEIKVDIPPFTPEELILTGRLLRVMRSGDRGLVDSVKGAVEGFESFMDQHTGMKEAANG